MILKPTLADNNTEWRKFLIWTLQTAWLFRPVKDTELYKKKCNCAHFLEQI